MSCLFLMGQRALACLALLAVLPLAGAGLEGTQTVSVRGGQIQVTVTYRNTSSSPVLLEKLDPGQDPMRPEFEVRSGAREISYTGPMAKRLPYAREDFFALEPGKEHVRKLRIESRYGFPPGRRRYSLAHVFLVWDEQAGAAVSHTLKPVRFSFGG